MDAPCTPEPFWRIKVSWPSLANISRLPTARRVAFSDEYVAFVSGHGASSQATSYSILKSWSPLSKLGAIFDFDNAGREDGARHLRPPGRLGVDYFFLPNTGADVVLEDLYSSRLRDLAQADNRIAQVITISQRPDGTEIGRHVQWNKDQLAEFFCAKANDAEWGNIEDFVETVVSTLATER